MSRCFRSEPMEYISLIVNEDAAHDCLSELGNLGVIQFTDVSNSLSIASDEPAVSLLLPC
jgi:V-type H+-transporting ATPase subunit a